MNILPIDFETHYSRDFSLSKMTMEEYIRSPEFEVIGVSVRDKRGTHWFSGTMDETYAWLHQFDWQNSAMLAHNAAFDGAILAWHFNITPRFYFDTLSMARPTHKVTVGGSLAALASYYKLGEKGTEVVNAMGKRRLDFTPEQLAAYGQYCINDTNLTYALFHRLKAGFPVPELMVIDQTMRMYTNPIVELDASRLQQHLDEVRSKKQALLETVEQLSGGSVPVKGVLMSNPKFAKLLHNLGVDPPTKLSLRTGKNSFAFAKTDRAMTDLLEHPDERVQAVVAARMGIKSTIEESRTEALLGVATRGRLPVMLNYYGAHTGRFCLTGDTGITVLRNDIVLDILLPELLPHDLVWDGDEFVAHGGLLDQGVREVITYGGITGTPDHRVFCEEVPEAVELREAAERGYTLKVAAAYCEHRACAADASSRCTWR